MDAKVKSPGDSDLGGPMELVAQDIATHLMNRSPAHLMLLDSAGLIFDINARTERLLNCVAADIRGEEPIHVFAAILVRAEAIGAERAERGFQIQHDHAWYEAQVFRAPQNLNDPNTEDYRVLRATDVTDRKSAEFELLESEARLEEATRIAKMGTYKLYWDTMKAIWSHQIYEIHGVAPESIDPSGTGYNELVHPDDRTKVAKTVRDLVAGREVADSQYRIIRGDGQLRWVTVDGRVLFDADGKPYATFGTIQDVTEIKNREEQLQELVSRNAVLTEVLQASPIGVAVITTQEEESRVFYANSAMESIFGADERYLIGKVLQDFVSDGADEEQLQELIRSIREDEHHSSELTFIRIDGSTFLGQIAVAPVHAEASREVIAHTLIVSDITDDRRRADMMMESQKKWRRSASSPVVSPTKSTTFFSRLSRCLTLGTKLLPTKMTNFRNTSMS